MQSRTLVVVTALLLGQGPALAQNGGVANAPPPSTAVATSQSLGDCMIAHVTAEHEQQMKTVLIDALQDNTESLNKSLLAMTMSVISMAQQQCGLKMTDLQTPQFGEAMEKLGEHMGEKIFANALAKVGAGPK